MLALDDRFEAAKSEALDKLLTIIRHSPSEREARLAAAVVLRLRRESFDEADSPPSPAVPKPPGAAAPIESPPPRPAAAASAAPEPLSEHELAELAAFLPSVPVRRFTGRHSPDYWRSVLARQRRFHSASGPPQSRAA